jgi:prepilin peptidase CpaA
MHSMIWWSTLALVVSAAVIDIVSRRIPNWLVLPFLVAGVAFGGAQHGLAGLEKSLGGIALAAGSMGILCWLRAMGMGDLKLCAAIGAWIGFSQLGLALIVTAIAGGVMAILASALKGSGAGAFDGVGDLLFGFWKRGFRPNPAFALDNPGGQKIPYAPAIAIGAIFSFFS